MGLCAHKNSVALCFLFGTLGFNWTTSLTKLRTSPRNRLRERFWLFVLGEKLLKVSSF